MTLAAAASLPGRTPGRRRRAFTLIELLAVISIIVILMAIAVTTGVLVIGRQNTATTRGLLASLDRALEEYIVSAGGTIPPYIDTAYESVPGEFLTNNTSSLKTNDPDDSTPNTVYLSRDYPRHPDAAVFIAQASGIGSVDKIIGGLGDRFLMPTPTYDLPADPDINHADVTPSVQDPWGDPALWAAIARDPTAHAWPVLDDSAHVIFYVHPGNLLAQALYGQCVNGRPYFFSAGPDGLYGTTSQLSGTGAIIPADADAVKTAVEGLKDNIYSYPVGPAHLDEHFNEENR